MKVIFVRHGHPDYTLDCLTELGHAQAEAAAERLKNEPIQAIYSSGKGRAIETAEHIAKVLGLPLQEPLLFMNEIAWRAPEGTDVPHNGQPWGMVSAMVAAGQELFHLNWQEEEPFCLHTKLLNLIPPMTAAFDQFLSGFGLEREGSYYRVRECSDTTIVIASHAGSSSVILSHLFNLPLPIVLKTMSPNFTAVTVVEISGEEGTLSSPDFEIMNDARHIVGISTEKIFNY